MSVRTTVYIDEEVRARLRRVVPQRGLNRFVNEALAEKVATVERQQLEQAMKEGYLATQRERDELNEDWGPLDTAEWPE